MNSKHLATLALSLSALAGGAAQAGGSADVQWSVRIGSPAVGVAIGHPPVYRAGPRVVVVPAYRVAPIGWRDADRDGIPNRYDRRYNPRGDRDRDGIPNRRDPRPYGR